MSAKYEITSGTPDDPREAIGAHSGYRIRLRVTGQGEDRRATAFVRGSESEAETEVGVPAAPWSSASHALDRAYQCAQSWIDAEDRRLRSDTR